MQSQDRRDQRVFLERVSTSTVDAKAVERRHAQGRGEIAVAAAAGHFGVLQVEAKFSRQRAGVLEQRVDRPRYLERRAVHAAGNLDPHVRVERPRAP